MKQLNWTRAALALFAIASLVGFGGVAFWMGDQLSTNALQLITTIVVLLGGVLKSADGFFFDGTPKQEQPKEPT
jgi:hypothetical protein